MLDKIPSPPTDNLYKFFTGVGLLLMLASLAGMIYLTGQYNEKRDSRTRESLNKLLADRRTDRAEALALVDKNHHEALLKHERLWKLVEGYRVRDFEFEHKILEAENQDMWRRTRSHVHLLGVVGAFGVILTTMGVSAWYTKHQKHQDEAARLEAQNKVQQNTIAELQAEKLRAEIRLLNAQVEQAETPKRHGEESAKPPAAPESLIQAA